MTQRRSRSSTSDRFTSWFSPNVVRDPLINDNDKEEEDDDAVSNNTATTTTLSESATTTTWHPGKFLGDARREVRRRAQEATRVADERLLVRADSKHDPKAFAVGEVVCEVIALDRLPVGHSRGPYVRVAFEGAARDTHRATSPVVAGARVEFEPCPRFTFLVTDAKSDVVVSIYASKFTGAQVLFVPPLGFAGIHDELLGKVVVPLSRLVGSTQVLPVLDTWFEILPLLPEHQTYAPVVDGMPKSGLTRPTSPLGRVRLRLELSLAVSVPEALMFVSPFRVLAPPIPPKPINPRAMRDAQVRLKVVIPLLTLRTPLACIMSWQEPRATGTAFFVSLIATKLDFWVLPLYFAVAFVGATKWWSMRPRIVTERCAPVKIYTDETIHSPEIPETLPQRIRALIKLAELLQANLNKIASFLERIVFAWSWEDEPVTLLLSIVAVFAGLLFSVVLLMVDVLLSIASFGHWMQVVVFVVFLHRPASTHIRKSRMFSMFSRATRTRASSSMEDSEQRGDRASTLEDDVKESDNDDNDEDTEEEEDNESDGTRTLKKALSVNESRLPDQDENERTSGGLQQTRRRHRRRVREVRDLAWFYDWKHVGLSIRVALSNLMQRIPDRREIDHRRIARGRESSL